MRNSFKIGVFVFGLSCAMWLPSTGVAQTQPADSSLHGTVIDPSGALVPGATVRLHGAGGEQTKITDASGQYSFTALAPGQYDIQVTAPDFGTEQRRAVEVEGAAVLNLQLMLETQSQVITVQENAAAVSVEPDANANALVLGKTELDALSDDPDELAQQLQALAGPGSGPQSGQIVTDGFTGTVPPKSSIREIRVNSNPFSSEYDSPGFGRVEILTKPGSDILHAQFSTQYNNENFNTRSPLYLQSPLPPYKNLLWNGTVTGPIKKDKASFTFDFNRRDITENAFILATNLDSSLNPHAINQAVLTPQKLTRLVPRLDLAINANQTLIVRYEDTRQEFDNLGVGSFRLAQAAYHQKTTSRILQVTETALLNPMLVNETRFQFAHFTTVNVGAGSLPSIIVQDAFTSGSAPVGDSSNATNRLELSNLSIFSHKTHTYKWGARLRQSFNNDRSVSNFNGTFTFFGGAGPTLDANGQPISGTSVPLTGLQVYKRTLELQQLGFSPSQIRIAGGGASLFSLAAGTPLTRVTQFDVGAFFNDDWKIRPNFTFSYGLRYENQTNIHDPKDWSPRISLAWGIDAKGTTPAKTVVRAGAGLFYNRVSDQTTLNARRYNGQTQQNYLLTNPDFFPNLPSLNSLENGFQPQTILLISGTMQAPQTYFANVGLDRQINKYLSLSLDYRTDRQVHRGRQRDVNAKLPGTNLFPYGDTTVRMLTESSGLERWQSLQIKPTLNFKKFSIFGFYSLGFVKNDFESLAANPYNLHAEWGPGWGDNRHYLTLGPTVPLPLNMTANVLFVYWSAMAYNVTTGLPDPSGDGAAVQRPALLNLSANSCVGATLKYTPQFGCFDLAPAAGAPTIQRNFARGPNNSNMTLRLSRTWSFSKKELPGSTAGVIPNAPGVPASPQGASTPSKYNLTLSIYAINPLNHPNFAAPNGNLTSPFFGTPLSLQGTFSPGNATYNRKVTMQAQWTF